MPLVPETKMVDAHKKSRETIGQDNQVISVLN